MTVISRKSNHPKVTRLKTKRTIFQMDISYKLTTYLFILFRKKNAILLSKYRLICWPSLISAGSHMPGSAGMSRHINSLKDVYDSVLGVNSDG